MSRPAVQSEASIQKACLQYLAAKHIFSIRINSGMQIGMHNGKKWAIHMAAPGTADILVILDVTDCNEDFTHKTIVWLEIKTEKGKQSEPQKTFEKDVLERGHWYQIIRSLDDLIAIVG
jgi:hypothetical protein